MAGLEQWLQMGGYALYVWGAYGLALGVVVINLWSVRRCERLSMRTPADPGERSRES